MKRTAFRSVYVFSIIWAFASCASLANYRIASPDEWIEQKPYPLVIRFGNADKVESCTLFYSLDMEKEEKVDLSPFGDEYRFVIPGEYMREGILSYYFIVRGEKDEHTSKVYKVRILSHRAAREKKREELRAGVVFVPPPSMPFFEDAVLPLIVRDISGTEVVLHYKGADDPAYKTSECRESFGVFRGIVPKETLEDGPVSYWFGIREEDEDLGTIEVTVPSSGEETPYRFRILREDDMLAIMESEMAKSVFHEPVSEAVDFEDLEISVDIRYPENSYLKRLSLSDCVVDLVYAGSSGKIPMRKAAMQEKGGAFTSILSSQALKDGYDSYYFVVTDRTDYIGKVEYVARDNGAMFSFPVYTFEEMAGRRKDQLAALVSSGSPGEIDPLEDYVVDLVFSEVPSATDVAFYIGKSDRRKFRERETLREGNVFSGRITAEEMYEGYDRYYFTITSRYPDVGKITVFYPEAGEKRPMRIRLPDYEQVKRELRAGLLKRIEHIPPLKADELSDLKLSVVIKNPEPETVVILNYLTKGGRTARTADASKTGNEWKAVIPKEEVRKGYSRYYFTVTEHRFPGDISVTLPENGAARPFEVTVERIEEAVLSGVTFEEIREVRPNQSVRAEISVNRIPSGMTVYLKYLVEKESGEAFVVEMTGDRNTYTATFAPSLLKPKRRVEYYFLFSIPQEGIEFTYPEKGRKYFSFVVNDKDEKNAGDEKEEKDKDKKDEKEGKNGE
ncbi:MAG: hypothetical protein JW881_15540 [Spirochaetales bacterium]|nr:hypothetical protein [Spirochaetales bacterium]